MRSWRAVLAMGAIAIVAGCGGAASTPTARPEPTAIRVTGTDGLTGLLPEGTELLYSRAGEAGGPDEGYQLFLVTPDGTTRQITSEPPRTRIDIDAASWSPSGRYILMRTATWQAGETVDYARDWEVRVLDVDSGTMTTIGDRRDGYPATSWIGDDTVLVGDQATGRIERYAADGSGRKRVAAPEWGGLGDLSPDGSTMILVPDGDYQTNGIMSLLDSQDWQVRELDVVAGPASYPTWSRDGRSIAFRSPDAGVMAIDLADGTVRSLVPACPDSGDGCFSTYDILGWSADGGWLTVDGQDGDRRGTWSIRTDAGTIDIPSGGTDAQMLFEGLASQATGGAGDLPIAYYNQTDLAGVIDPDGLTVTDLSGKATWLQSWSPDGSAIGYLLEHLGGDGTRIGMSLGILSADGGTGRPLTPEADDYWGPFFRPGR